MHDLFWEKVTQRASSLGINDPQLPRCRKRPRRYDDGISEGDFHITPKACFRQRYYEAIDVVLGCIENRPGYSIYSTLETLLVKACKQEEIEGELEVILSLHNDDFDPDLLKLQLQTFGTHYEQMQENKSDISRLTIFDVENYFSSISLGQRLLLSQVEKLLKMVLVIPATNATSERSFNALRLGLSLLCSKFYLLFFPEISQRILPLFFFYSCISNLLFP